MIDLRGQTAVITGGGRGLGRSFAQALDGVGASVAVIARSSAELDETVKLLDSNARAFAADVTDSQAIRDAFAQIGPVDLLVNNAGTLGPIGPFAGGDFDEWCYAIEVNLRGAMLCTHAVLSGMHERRRGRIVNKIGRASCRERV